MDQPIINYFKLIFMFRGQILFIIIQIFQRLCLCLMFVIHYRNTLFLLQLLMFKHYQSNLEQLQQRLTYKHSISIICQNNQGNPPIYFQQISYAIINYQQKLTAMYSKYVDYHDSAVKAHREAQSDNDQKDVLISHLKNDVYQLRQLQGDFLRLNQLILSLEEKYSLLMDEKERSQKQQRTKTQIDKNSILDLKEDIQYLKVQLQKAHIHIQQLMRENSGMKRMSDARASQIQNIRYEIKGMQNKNDRAHQENKDISHNIKILKQQRIKLESQCQDVDRLLDANVAKLKNLQKQVRNSESTNARLDKTLHQAQNDNVKLVAELKQKNDEAKKAQNKLNSLKNNIQEMKITRVNLENQAQKNRGDAANNAANLSNQVGKGKQLSAKLSGVQASIRAQQSQLDAIIAQEEKLRKQHYSGLQQNKQLNNEIDKILALIAEYQQVNKQLIDELEIYIDQDEQARAILNRRQQMRQIIESSLRKIQVSSQPIRHLKY